MTISGENDAKTRPFDVGGLRYRGVGQKFGGIVLTHLHIHKPTTTAVENAFQITKTSTEESYAFEEDLRSTGGKRTGHPVTVDTLPTPQ